MELTDKKWEVIEPLISGGARGTVPPKAPPPYTSTTPPERTRACPVMPPKSVQGLPLESVHQITMSSVPPLLLHPVYGFPVSS